MPLAEHRQPEERSEASHAISGHAWVLQICSEAVHQQKNDNMTSGWTRLRKQFRIGSTGSDDSGTEPKERSNSPTLKCVRRTCTSTRRWVDIYMCVEYMDVFDQCITCRTGGSTHIWPNFQYLRSLQSSGPYALTRQPLISGRARISS